MKKLFLSLILLSPFFVLAEDAEDNGLVPCKIGECELCHLFVLFDNVIDYVLFILVPILAPFMILLGGVVLVFAYINPNKGPENLNRAKDIFKTVAIGIVLVYGAWTFVGVFFDVLGFVKWDSFTGERWEVEDCNGEDESERTWHLAYKLEEEPFHED